MLGSERRVRKRKQQGTKKQKLQTLVWRVLLEVQAHQGNSLEIRVENRAASSPGQWPSAQELKAIMKGWAARGGKRQPQAGSHLLGERHRQTNRYYKSIFAREKPQSDCGVHHLRP